MLRKAVESAAEVLGESDAQHLVHKHPSAVLRGEPLDLKDFSPIPFAAKKRSWLSSILRRH